MRSQRPQARSISSVPPRKCLRHGSMSRIAWLWDAARSPRLAAIHPRQARRAPAAQPQEYGGNSGPAVRMFTWRRANRSRGVARPGLGPTSIKSNQASLVRLPPVPLLSSRRGLRTRHTFTDSPPPSKFLPNPSRVCLVLTKFSNFPNFPSHLLSHRNIKYSK